MAPPNKNNSRPDGFRILVVAFVISSLVHGVLVGSVWRARASRIVNFEPSAPIEFVERILRQGSTTTSPRKSVPEKTALPEPGPAQTAPSTASGAVDQPLSTRQLTVREAYLGELRALIDSRKNYPEASRRMREMGQVIVEFEVDRAGQVHNAHIKTPCSFERLNEAALKMVGSLERVPPLPSELNLDKLIVQIPLEYKTN